MSPFDPHSALMRCFGEVDPESFGFPIYLVGGCVRDILRGALPVDYDLVCRDAALVSETLASVHNAKRIVWKKDFTDVVTHRLIFRNPSSPVSELDITGFRGKTLAEDLSARDFTINAMALPLRREGFGEMIDPFGGRIDLFHQNALRMTGPSVFADDPLRILRAYRFSLFLDLSFDPKTKAVLQKTRGELRRVSAERIAKELFALLAHDHAAETVRMMDHDGVLAEIFPEILPMKGFAQNAYHRFDVWEHSMRVFDSLEAVCRRPETDFGDVSEPLHRFLQGRNHRALLKLAALLHDAGKPASAVQKEAHGVSFRGHPAAGADIVHDIGNRLRFSRKDIHVISTIVADHLRVRDLWSEKTRRSTRLSWIRKQGDIAAAVVALGLADERNKGGPASRADRAETAGLRARNLMTEIFEASSEKPKAKLPVTGRDLLSLGLTPGPEIGNILRQLQAAYDNRVLQTRAELLNAARELAAETGRDREND